MLEETSEFCKILVLTKEYRQIVEKIARSHTINTTISWEDAIQTAYTKVWQAIQTGRYTEDQVKEFYHWAAKVAKNAIIDLVRKEKHQKWQSLDQNIPGTNVSLVDTVADKFDLPEAIEYKDLLLKTIQVIEQLDLLYPERGYLQLWEGLKQGKNQSQLAGELNLNQGTISKRRKELSLKVGQMLGLFEVDDIKQELQKNRQQRRSNTR
ncbi:MAG: sigma-70 family RNA polymerase sigma factor [Cyanomargarita calcarea GSE-NOS-MK-12-04C]|jgi:RNA polymerase sporulation-specific sigma factor|uniref:Sigma-70 family RNA polymerase sigma factor n=1 Tax=Cyanomargarita calcarea GSE-NOS-MK-12-04C TaxID=2839659 RepID=A0A951QTT7_9CYAN|nr:sigma-70 family RNA polymerase sigma factor [Cyanomargarita calcarea GSE-NOS-MK-12-04C]